MAEEINRKNQKEIVRQRQIEIARSMKVKPEILEILGKVEEWQNREWLYICALDGMSAEEIAALQHINASTGQIRKARLDHLRKMCTQTDLFQNKLEVLQKEVQEVCKESREARSAIENGLEAALKKQAQAQAETIRTKDQMIEMLRLKIEDLEQRLLEMNRREEVEKQENPYKKNNSIQDVPDHSVPEKKQEKAVEQRQYRDSGKGLVKLFTSARKDSDIKRFIETYIKDDNLTTEQKEFLLDCMEEGLSIKEIEKFAAPGLSVEVMQRLKKLQMRAK